MTVPLDLAITLTPPPADAPEGTLARIGLSCPALGASHEGDLLRDPLSPAEHEQLRWYLEEYWRWPYAEFAARGRQVETLLAEAGRRLYNAVFGTVAARDLLQGWRGAQVAGGRQISIVSHVAAALRLPWELLHDAQGFLTLRDVSIVRRLPQTEGAADHRDFQPPLRVLLVTARPDDAGWVDQRAIARELLDEVQAQVEAGALAVEFLRPPTLAALRERLRDETRPVHVLHFDGHGAFAEGGTGSEHLLSGRAQGQLAFEDEAGRMERVEADRLANVLQASGVRLVVLTACQSAVGAADDAFSSVAGRLIQGGVDAVVAMGASVLVVAATRYAEAFYRQLAQGTPAPTAHERARQALYDNPRRHPFQRRADEEGQPVTLQDWWLPHFYQQRPLQLQPGRRRRRRAVEPPRFSGFPGGGPRERQRRFVGRARELLSVERWLRRGKLVVVHGFGGVGKTALAEESADWLARTGMVAGALFHSFEHGSDAAALLSALGRHLDVTDAAFNPADPAAALPLLRPHLRQRRTLVIADNLESILPEGEAVLDGAERARLWETLHALRDAGAAVLLTTRAPDLGDTRMAPGTHVAHLPLRGLRPDDGYALAATLLEAWQVDRARAPYADLRDLLAQLDHHPLAIQLVLPALRDLPLARIRDDFAALLPRFQDDAESGRNRSLLASLDFSLRRLSAAQRALLPRLALFEGGAMELEILAITEIPEATWAELRAALEQAALLVAERVHEAISVPFLRFHPVLAPFLRGQPGADDPALRQRHAARYYALANYLYHEDGRNPIPVRALVRRELPNLRRALDTLLASGDTDAATEMADSIAWFLSHLGLLRERDELRRKVGQVGNLAHTLTRAEWLHNSGLGEDEWRRGELKRAFDRFTHLLTRHTELPANAPLGPNSYEHCQTLHSLARCLRIGGQPDTAEARLREALAVIELIIAQQPDEQVCIRQRGLLLTDLGDALRDQGKFPQAEASYEAAEQIAKQQGDIRQQGVNLGQLGTLALRLRNYSDASQRYSKALQLAIIMKEPTGQATYWYQLGVVAGEQQHWSDAERCYRESLMISEQLGDIAGAAKLYNQLANVVRGAGRPDEAERWYGRALLHADALPNHGATVYNNLAALILTEVRVGRTLASRLSEARGHAERALAIRETLDASSEIWMTLSILAGIEKLEGRVEAEATYRRRERETFAAFEGNRWHIDNDKGDVIVAIVAAAQGHAEMRAAVEGALPTLEAKGWRIAAATRRLWAGERDWHALAEGIDCNSALLILRVLETLADPQAAPQVG